LYKARLGPFAADKNPAFKRDSLKALGYRITLVGAQQQRLRDGETRWGLLRGCWWTVSVPEDPPSALVDPESASVPAFVPLIKKRGVCCKSLIGRKVPFVRAARTSLCRWFVSGPRHPKAESARPFRSGAFVSSLDSLGAVHCAAAAARSSGR